MVCRLLKNQLESSILGVNSAKTGLASAVSGLDEAKANFERWQRQTEEAFKDVVKIIDW